MYLASQTVVNDVRQFVMSDQAAISDVLSFLKKRGGNRYVKHLKISYPDTLVDAWKSYSSADLVITSRMHVGIIALSLGIPSLFILPLKHVKVHDILSFMGLNADSFFIETFDESSLRAEAIAKKAEKILENLGYYGKTIESSINRVMPTLELPFNTLVKLLG